MLLNLEGSHEFLGDVFKNDLIENEYGIKAKCTTPANSQYNNH